MCVYVRSVAILHGHILIIYVCMNWDRPNRVLYMHVCVYVHAQVRAQTDEK